jgi:hypothetical protein
MLEVWWPQNVEYNSRRPFLRNDGYEMKSITPGGHV